MTDAHAYAQTLGEEESIWFKISPFVNAKDPMDVLMRMNARYGGCIPINVGSERMLFLSDIGYIRRVLVEKVDSYAKYFEGLKPIFGKAMITVDGTLWQKLRKPQQPLFHPKVYEDYLPHLRRSVHLCADEWTRFADSGETVEMVEQTWCLAADMVCRALFDREMPFNPEAVFGAVKAYTDVENHKSIRLKKVAGGLTEVTDDEVAAQAIGAWLSLPEAVIGAAPLQDREHTLLLMLQAAETDPTAPEFDHQQVLDEMKQYLWAGTETTALTLGWVFYLLSQHPDVTEKIRQEGVDVYGDRDPSWDDVQKLTYTRSVMLETLRLFPPAWALIRTAMEADEIAGHKVEPGDRIVLSPYVVHHNPEYWSDPEEFRPERFEPGCMQKRLKYSYLPFGGGKRFCLGGQLAQLEIVLALTMLLRRFHVDYCGEVPAPINATAMLTPRGGLPFRLHARS